MIEWSQEFFIKKAIEVHGDKYDYSEVEFKSCVTKVKIFCKFHKEFFWQQPRHHLKGQNCKKCGYLKNTMSQETFIKKANEKHNNKYNYSLVDYKNAGTKVEIICSSHGSFFMKPYSHLIGAQCEKCISPNRKIITQVKVEKNKKPEIKVDSRINDPSKKEEYYIENFKKVHEDKYDYSKFKLINRWTESIIICKKHDVEFLMSPRLHIEGKGCVLCGRKIPSLNEFIEMCKTLHKNKYDYKLLTKDDLYHISKKSQKNGKSSKLICDIHGEFNISLSNHLKNGYGCPICAKNVSIPETQWLDSLLIDNKYRQKSLRINGKLFRVDAFIKEDKHIFEFFGIYWHGHPDFFDQNKENPSCYKTFGELYQKTLDRIEIFKKEGYKLTYIWEHEFKNG